MSLYLPLIAQDAFNKLTREERILIKEFREGLTSKWKTYTSSVLLFRPLLIHFAYHIYREDKTISIDNYSLAIELLDKKINFDKKYLNFLIELKNIVNSINHDRTVMTPDRDDDIVNGMWDFIKWIAENVLVDF